MKLFYLIISFFTISTCALNAQELFVEGGKSITSFSFRDVFADELDNLRSTNHTYIDLGYRGKLFGEQVQFIGGLGLHTYGTIGSDNTQNTYFEWETTYASIYGGIDIRVIQANRFSFHVRATVAPEFLMQGTRVLNNEVLDIKGREDFDTPIIFLRGAASFEYRINSYMAAFLQYRYGQGTQLEKSASGGELTYFAQDFGLGLIFSIKEGASQ
ncbi:hypothetical protein POV27_01945 [Aureisphaera galaxeae]|uniref:hypothetical protein n=1 Tax=Aureisphaera galaxeae TaxID=1538023 RepID=UPI00234FBAE2|nr:hypothetical protein [Aureisphaera galaxeae]MDC8002803.1 hypothetical protein [Aureisphaera galaxeae]